MSRIKKLFTTNFLPEALNQVFNYEISTALKLAFLQTFVTKTTLQKTLHNNPLYLALHFLGFPLSFNSKDSLAKQIVEGFIGWHQDDAPTYEKILNYTLIKPLLMLVWNLIATPAKALWNGLTFIAEYLPYAGKLLGNFAISSLKNIYNNQNQYGIIRAAAAIGMAAFVLLYTLTNLTHGLVRCITSPAQAATIAWQEGEKIGGLKGKIIGAILGAGSLGISVAVYTFLFPLLIHASITYAPVAIAEVVSKTVMFLNAIPGLTSLGTALGSLFAGLTFPVSASVIGVGSIFAISLPIVNFIKFGYDTLSNWLQSQNAPVQKTLDGEISAKPGSSPYYNPQLRQNAKPQVNIEDYSFSSPRSPRSPRFNGFTPYPTSPLLDNSLDIKKDHQEIFKKR